MRRGISWGSLVLLLVCLLPAPAADEKQEKGNASKDKLVVIGEIVGRLTRIEGAQKYLAVQVSRQVLAPAAGGMNPLALLQQQQAIMRIPNPIARQQQLLQLVRQMQGGGYSIQQVQQNIELQADDDLKVRMLHPPVEFDDKGKPRRLSANELKELKGPDPKIPGYQADFDSLKAEQIVRVTVARKKDAVKPMPKQKGKAKEKDADSEIVEEEKPVATMVVILQEPIK